MVLNNRDNCYFYLKIIVFIEDFKNPEEAECAEGGEWPAAGGDGNAVDGLKARVILSEGKYHQVKRMIAACGGAVAGLHRVAVGGLALDPALAPGRARPLTRAEHAVLAESLRGTPRGNALRKGVPGASTGRRAQARRRRKKMMGATAVHAAGGAGSDEEVSNEHPRIQLHWCGDQPILGAGGHLGRDGKARPRLNDGDRDDWASGAAKYSRNHAL